MYYKFLLENHLYPDCKTWGDCWVYSLSKPPKSDFNTWFCLNNEEVPEIVLKAFEVKSKRGWPPHCVLTNQDGNQIVDITYLLGSN